VKLPPIPIQIDNAGSGSGGGDGEGIAYQVHAVGSIGFYHHRPRARRKKRRAR
jgi:hypothetical protein